MNRNRLIVGIVAFLLVLIVIAGARWLVRSLNHPRPASQRILIVRLGYCGGGGIRPCVASFSQDGKGNMLVDILLPSSSFPDFYLSISKEGEEHLYRCEKVKGSPTRVQCTGMEMQPGEAMQFTLISIADHSVLAEGNFPIIGLLLVAPGAEVAGVVQPAESPTPSLFEIPTPRPTLTPSSYPNPSYPNPSYPNPSYPNP